MRREIKTGAVCLAFLIVGYQLALFVSRAAVLRIEANRDKPDTIFIYADSIPAGPGQNFGPSASLPSSGGHSDRAGGYSERHEAEHSPRVEAVRKATRRVETFRFDPNRASADELQRLGFSEKQAAAIINYREKGGRFRRRQDFARSFVVSDSIYRRLEKYIDIPKLDINRADSAAFDELPGIGPYFAAKMVSYREELGGYSYPEQLMDIYRFDREKFDGLSDLIFCSECKPFDLWTLPAEELRKHPYIGDWRTAHAIVLFRENSPADSLTVAALGRAGIIPPDNTARLSRCRISAPLH